MADISQLGGLNPVETLTDSMYKTAKVSTFSMPKAGRYTLRSPESFPATAFGKTQAGNLSVSIDPTIAGPTNEGTQIRYARVSAKVFDRDGGKASQAGDYLKACGYSGEIPGDPQEIANLVEQTAGAQFEAILDWEATHRASGFKVKGMRNFPSDGNGGYQSWVNHPTETTMDDAGNKVPLRLRANIVIARFLPKTN